MVVRNCLISLLLILLINASSSFVTPGGGGAVLPKVRKSAQHNTLHQHQYKRTPITRLNADTNVLGRNLAVAGRIPWRKLLINKAQARKIISIMRAETHSLDLIIVFILSVFPETIGQFL